MAPYELRTVGPEDLPRGPVAGLRTAPGSVTLELPGRGRVTVAGEEVTVEATSPEAGATLYAELRTWATGQRRRQAGLVVLGGACVEVEGRAVVLAARPRNGASFAALGLVRAGGRLVSDGVTALAAGPDGFSALPGDPWIELDGRAVAPGSTQPVRPTGSGSGRVLLEAERVAEPVAVGAVVILVARLNLRDVAVAPADAATAPARLATTAVPDLSRKGRPRGRLEDLVTAVPVTTLLLPVRASTPQVLAEAVLGIVTPAHVR